MFKRLIFAAVLFLCGCQHLQIPENFEYKEIKTDDFTIASWQKVSDAQEPVKIYIEGDGTAFNAHGQPSYNPTPKGVLLREIAFNDYQENVAYLARPCQFVKDNQCVQKYWTTARFASEVIRAEASAIRQIAQGREVILIGFSGGAQVAGLVTVLNPDIRVKKLVTIGGNLDHKAWTAYHNLPPLSDSLNLVDYKEKYLQGAQIHYVGTKDKVIPPALVKAFAKPDNIKEIANAQHDKDWESIYPLIWAEK